MPNPLMDWREWLLAILTGLVGAAFFAWLQQRWRLRRWRRLRTARLGDLWKEIAWIGVQLRLHGWAPDDLPGSAKGIFPGYISDLQKIDSKRASEVSGIDPAALDLRESAIVFTHIPGIRRLTTDVVILLDDCLNDYREAWATDTLEHLVEARTALRRLIRWDPPPTLDPKYKNLQVGDGVEYALKALIALNWISIVVAHGSGGVAYAEWEKADPTL